MTETAQVSILAFVCEGSFGQFLRSKPASNDSNSLTARRTEPVLARKKLGGWGAPGVTAGIWSWREPPGGAKKTTSMAPAETKLSAAALSGRVVEYSNKEAAQKQRKT